MPDFESGAFNRSAISPHCVFNYLQPRLPSVSVTYDMNYDINSSRVWLRASIKPPHRLQLRVILSKSENQFILRKS